MRITLNNLHYIGVFNHKVMLFLQKHGFPRYPCLTWCFVWFKFLKNTWKRHVFIYHIPHSSNDVLPTCELVPNLTLLQTELRYNIARKHRIQLENMSEWKLERVCIIHHCPFICTDPEILFTTLICFWFVKQTWPQHTVHKYMYTEASK